VFDSAGGVAVSNCPARHTCRRSATRRWAGGAAISRCLSERTAGTEVTCKGRADDRPDHSCRVRDRNDRKTSTQRTRVTLMSADGMRQFVLEDADTVQVADPLAGPHRARAGIAAPGFEPHHAPLTIRIKARANGRSGRLCPEHRCGRHVSPDARAGNLHHRTAARWATLENQSGADWKGVTLTLQYGNP